MPATARDPDGVGRLHVLTDPDGPRPVARVVDAALQAGAPTIQIRRKDGSDRDRLAEIEDLLARCRAAGATCVVNDRVDLALASGADGVHLGDGDLPVEAARRLAGPDLIVGATVRDAAAARAAAEAGASYVGVGPTLATGTKRVDVAPLGIDRVAEIAAAAPVPAVAIAGITPPAAAALVQRGLAGVAVVSAVSRAPDPGAACAELLDAVEDGG